MVPFTIRLLLEFLDEKERQARALDEEIETIERRLDDEFRHLLTEYNPNLPHDLQTDLTTLCTSPENPVGYCADNGLDPCLFCSRQSFVEAAE